MIPLSVLAQAIRGVPAPLGDGELASEPQQFGVRYVGQWLCLVVSVLQMLVVDKRGSEVVRLEVA